MIHVEKLQPGPTVLLVRGGPARDAFCASHDGGVREFEYDRDIYAHDEVKSALIAAQHGKCAFCESKVTHISYGDVEHYRPKGGFRQRDDMPLEQPGYYWLSYDWNNLFLSCQICNQRFKKNLFPLFVQRNRARSHSADINLESPLLLNPSADPERHLTFRDEIAEPRNRSRSGAVTVQVVGLNRPEIVERRLDRLNQLRYFEQSREVLSRLLGSPGKPKPDLVRLLAEVERALADAQLDTAEYTAMARAFLA